MAPKKGVSPSLAEGKNKKPACAECRKRKKRCPHRDDLSLASEANDMPAAAVPETESAAGQVDEPILVDDNTPPAEVPPALEGDQGRSTTSPASGLEVSSVAARDAADPPSEPPVKRVKLRGPRRPSPVPIPEDDPVEGSTALSVHVVLAKELAEKLEEFEAKYQASMTAHLAVMEAGKAVKKAVDVWRAAWEAGR